MLSREESGDFTVIPIDEESGTILVNEQQKVAKAFQKALEETVLDAVMHTPQAMSMARASADIFYRNGLFSWRQTAKMSSALAIGGAAAFFCVEPAKEAVVTIIRSIEEKTGINVPSNLAYALTLLFQIANTSETSAITILSAKNMLDDYFEEASETERFLTHYNATRLEKYTIFFRKLYNLLSSIATNIPTYIITSRSANPILAAITAISNVSLSWKGISELHFVNNVHPAWEALLIYLHEQLDAFIALPLSVQMQKLDAISTLDSIDSEPDAKKILLQLLTFAKSAQTDMPIVYNQEPPTARTAKAFAAGLGVCSATAELMFSEYAGVGVAQLFDQPKSPEAVAAGISVALIAAMPCFGFGWIAGTNAGKEVINKHPKLAALYKNKTREGLKALIHFLSIFAGGTMFTMGYNTANDIAEAANLGGLSEDILKGFLGVFCHAGGAIENDYYSLCLLDKVFEHYAQRCADDNIRRLFKFVGQTRQLFAMLARTSENNYLSLLSWLMDNTNPLLSDLLHGIFDNRLSKGEYEKLQKALNTQQYIVKDRTQLSHYELLPNFFTKSTARYRYQRFTNEIELENQEWQPPKP